MKHSLILRLSFFVLFMPIMISVLFYFFLFFTKFSLWLADFNLIFLLLIGFSLGIAIISLGALGIAKGLSYLIGIMEYDWLKKIASWATLGVCAYDGYTILSNMWNMLDFSFTTHVVAIIIVGIGVMYMLGFLIATLLRKEI